MGIERRRFVETRPGLVEGKGAVDLVSADLQKPMIAKTFGALPGLAGRLEQCHRTFDVGQDRR